MYNNYCNLIENIIKSENLEYFKSHHEYTGILEHVDEEQGKDYLNLIKDEFKLNYEDIIDYINLNDKIGSPTKKKIENILCSPTSLRYIYHANLILKNIRNLNLNDINIVEVGCGYGGLCLAISIFANKYSIKINNYNLIDLKPVIELQKLYLSNFKLPFNTIFHDSNTFGSNIEHNDLYLISNYCYSEIDISLRRKYSNILFPKVSHGFIAWNDLKYIELIRDDQIVEDERPCTQVGNKYIIF
jgi:hypothetical protein